MKTSVRRGWISAGLSEVRRARREEFELKKSENHSMVPLAKTGLSSPHLGSRLASRHKFPMLQQGRECAFLQLAHTQALPLSIACMG